MVTWPDPSRRKTLPNVDLATFVFRTSIELLIENMIEDFNLLDSAWRKRGYGKQDILAGKVGISP